jgi:hypothetical protein
MDKPYLLINLPVREDVLERNVKLAQVVFPKSVMIPTNALQQRDAHHGHLERDVPFRIEGFEYRRGRLACISKGDDEILEDAQP